MTYSEQRRIDALERIAQALERIADKLAPEAITDGRICCYYHGGACVHPDMDCEDCERRHLKEEFY